jgi:6-pyruvoyltetrahydropterin/6-carboxytetrahydropterin synthase
MRMRAKAAPARSAVRATRRCMFEITVEESFAAGHALRGYRGKCENPHGHNYRVCVKLVGPELDEIGLLYDFRDLKHAMREFSERLDHQYLNDLQEFSELNPSAENIARLFYLEMKRALNGGPRGVRVASVTVYETDTTAAVYSEAGD